MVLSVRLLRPDTQVNVLNTQCASIYLKCINPWGKLLDRSDINLITEKDTSSYTNKKCLTYYKYWYLLVQRKFIYSAINPLIHAKKLKVCKFVQRKSVVLRLTYCT